MPRYLAILLVFAFVVFLCYQTQSALDTRYHQQSIDQKLIYAVWKNHHSDVVNLIKQGANPNQITSYSSLENSQKSMMRRVYNVFFPEINIDDCVGCGSKEITLLHLATDNHNPRMVQFLLKSGASANLVAYQGESPLIDAVLDGDLAIVNILLKYHADPNFKNVMNKTPLTYALSPGSPSTLPIIATLLNHGADPYRIIDGHENFLDQAEWMNNKRVVSLILKHRRPNRKHTVITVLPHPDKS